MALKCTWGALVCATWLVVVAVVDPIGDSTWIGLLEVLFYVAFIAGILLALTGATLAMFDRKLARAERTFAISVGVVPLIAVPLLILWALNDLSKLS